MLNPVQRQKFHDFGYSDVLISRLDQIDLRREYGPVALARLLHVGRASITRAVRYRDLKICRPGSTIRILGADYIDWVIDQEVSKINRFESPRSLYQKY